VHFKGAFIARRELDKPKGTMTFACFIEGMSIFRTVVRQGINPIKRVISDTDFQNLQKIPERLYSNKMTGLYKNVAWQDTGLFVKLERIVEIKLLFQSYQFNTQRTFGFKSGKAFRKNEWQLRNGEIINSYSTLTD